MPAFPIEEIYSLNSADDITHRSGYEYPVSTKKSNFVRILAVYSLNKSSINCGVSDCLEEHQKGYLVLTPNEQETCLCQACGKRFFAADFDEQQNDFVEQNRIRKQKSRLNNLLEQTGNIKEKIDFIKKQPHGANWLYKSLTHFKQAYPSELIRALKTLAANNEENRVLATLIESEADSSNIEAVRQLQGLSIFISDIREELIGKILMPLVELEKIAASPDETPSLARFGKLTDHWQSQLEKAEILVREGQAFFHIDNIARLKSIPLSKENSRKVKSLHWNCDKGDIK